MDTTLQSPSKESMSSGNETENGQDQRSRYQKIYNAFGFSKAYNFPLCKLEIKILLSQIIASWTRKRDGESNLQSQLPITFQTNNAFCA